ncbi:MAG: sugar phosphate isomerase/epimerase, partial [Akkermansiaceae bacterium]|nr:sugar phosphate isomerase/epimerase [Akkermansiaceae bacterium]
MKFGFNVLLWTPSLQEDQFHLLGKLRQTGYDGVELPIFSPDVAHNQKIGAALKNEGLRSTVVTIIPDEARSPISPVAANRAAALDYLKQIVDSCHACHAEVMMGPFHQPLGVFSGSGPTHDEQKWAADVHRELAEYAQPA